MFCVLFVDVGVLFVLVYFLLSFVSSFFSVGSICRFSTILILFISFGFVVVSVGFRCWVCRDSSVQNSSDAWRQTSDASRQRDEDPG